ncbi:hypothetical protein Tco_0928704 [Tanacetum coccineum]
MFGHILHVHLTQPQTTSVPEQQYQLYILMKNNPQLQQQDIAVWLALQMKFETLQAPQSTCRTSTIRRRDQDDPHDDAPPERENSAKRQKTSEYEAHVTGESSGQVNKSEHNPSFSSNQEQVDDYDFWTESKEILVSPHPRKTTPLVQSCQRDPEAPALSLINQDLLYLKKRNSGPEKIVLSLHKFPAIIFNDVDIKERTFRWVNKCVQKFNPYARSFKLSRHTGNWELGHEHKFITEIVAKRANECIVSITESDYKNLNKNDIEDIYLMIVNGKVPDYAETGIEKHKMFSIIYELMHGIIYKNSKKEKRVMRHSEIHKFCDATLNRVLESLKSYNNDVKYGYKQRDLTEDEVEYLKLFKEEIEVRLKYRNQMRRWEMYVIGKPLGPRRERPE